MRRWLFIGCVALLTLVCPSLAAAQMVVAPGEGCPSQVHLIEPSGTRSIFPYDPRFLGGVSVAMGDVNADGVPDIITRGFVMENSQDLLAEGARLLVEVIERASVEERTDQGVIKEQMRVELRRFFRKRSGRRPFVVPVIMEI